MTTEQFDGVLLGIAQGCRGGVPEMLDVVFGFLARKTDFYVGSDDPNAAKAMVDAAFDKHKESAQVEAKKKKVLSNSVFETCF